MIGKKIKQLREEQKLTQIELAKKLNISNTTLSQYETGQRVPSDDIKIKLAEYFNVTTDYLLGRFDIEKELRMLSEKERKLKESTLDLLSLSPDTERILVQGHTITPAREIIKYILKQPALMAYGEYDFETMSEDEITDLVFDLLYALKLSIERQQRKKRLSGMFD